MVPRSRHRFAVGEAGRTLLANDRARSEQLDARVATLEIGRATNGDLQWQSSWYAAVLAVLNWILHGLWMALSVEEPDEQATLLIEGGGVSLRRRTVDVVGGMDGLEVAVLWAPAPQVRGKVRQTADPSAGVCLLFAAHSA